MSTIPAMYNRGADGSITGVTFYLNFVPYQSDSSHAGFPALLEELKSAQPDEARLVALTQPIQAVKAAVADAVAADYLPAGVVGVTSSTVTYNGEEITGVLVERILTMLAEGFDIMPMVKFLENVYRNPALYARDELYLWLEQSDLPITADGCFLAYKNVRPNFGSWADPSFDNTPGTTPSMDRNSVNPNRYQTCAAGLHFCSKGYLSRYSSGPNNVVLILKINPADVVSIPADYNNAKGRAWKYEVLRTVDDAASKVWPSVVDEGGDDIVPDADDEAQEDQVDDGDEPLEFPSELAGALFAAYGEIEESDDRDARIDWANAMLPYWHHAIDSFHDLTKDQARLLIEAARQHKELLDAEAEEAADDAEAAAKQARIDAINSYGIVKLRKLTGHWKGWKVADMRRLLIDQLG